MLLLFNVMTVLHLPTASGIIKSNPNPVGKGQVAGSSVRNILTICEMKVTQICVQLDSDFSSLNKRPAARSWELSESFNL